MSPLLGNSTITSGCVDTKGKVSVLKLFNSLNSTIELYSSAMTFTVCDPGEAIQFQANLIELFEASPPIIFLVPITVSLISKLM